MQEDSSPYEAALRETFEELGIQKHQVQLLGTVGPPILSYKKLRVYPFVVRRFSFHATFPSFLNPNFETGICISTQLLLFTFITGPERSPARLPPLLTHPQYNRSGPYIPPPLL